MKILGSTYIFQTRSHIMCPKRYQLFIEEAVSSASSQGLIHEISLLFNKGHAFYVRIENVSELECLL